MLEAGRKYLSALSSKSVAPDVASTISKPHSPLLTGGVANKTSRRAEKRLAAASACDFSFLAFVERAGSEWARSEFGTEIRIVQAKISATHRRVPLRFKFILWWYIATKESIVERPR